MGGERREDGEKIEKKARRLKKGTKEKKLIKGGKGKWKERMGSREKKTTEREEKMRRRVKGVIRAK